MRGLPQKQNARRADKIKLCGHLRRYKKIVKKTYIIYMEIIYLFVSNAFNKSAYAFIQQKCNYTVNYTFYNIKWCHTHNCK